MKGLEISRKFYEEYGKPMLESQFPELLDVIAVGSVGKGSENFGFDDEISRDHDFEAGFTVFLPDEDRVDRRTEFLLERAYSKLPKEFCGVKRGLLSPVGGNRNGPKRMSDFFKEEIGSPDGSLSVIDWLTLPDSAFAEVTNGEVFYDGSGEFTAIREKLLLLPEDIRLKRIAGNLLIMAQSGQYNFLRCAKRQEYEAAVLSSHEFVNAAIKTVFLLNFRFAPYYKWSFRALKELGETKIADLLSELLLTGVSDIQNDIQRKYDIIENVSSLVTEKLISQGITEAVCGDLEKHAYSVNDAVTDGEIRNYSILISV